MRSEKINPIRHLSNSLIPLSGLLKMGRKNDLKFDKVVYTIIM